MRTATAALRREVDRLDIKMKEDIATLKHEYIVSSLCIDTASNRNPFAESRWN
jgi:hypothetical protein